MYMSSKSPNTGAKACRFSPPSGSSTLSGSFLDASVWNVQASLPVFVSMAYSLPLSTHVGESSGQRRGGENVGPRIEVESQPSRLRVQGHEAGTVGCSHVHRAVHDRRR